MEQNELQTGIGTEEAATLKPTKVKVESVDVIEIENKVKKGKSKKVVCSVRHPDATEAIKISGVKYEDKGKLVTAGLWINKDSQDKIRKGSALAVLMQSIGATVVSDIKDKDIDTVADEKGYLVFKAY